MPGTLDSSWEDLPIEMANQARVAFSKIDSFSERKRTIARMVGQGFTNQQIANRLQLSPNTVHFHLKEMYRALGVTCRAALAAVYQMYVADRSRHHDTGSALT
jgi:DNA-binding NarL/FixJ family response regulator